jgi:hypothetical protein
MRKKPRSGLPVSDLFFSRRASRLSIADDDALCVEAQREASQKQGVSLNAADLKEYGELCVSIADSTFSQYHN